MFFLLLLKKNSPTLGATSSITSFLASASMVSKSLSFSGSVYLRKIRDASLMCSSNIAWSSWGMFNMVISYFSLPFYIIEIAEYFYLYSFWDAPQKKLSVQLDLPKPRPVWVATIKVEISCITSSDTDVRSRNNSYRNECQNC